MSQVKELADQVTAAVKAYVSKSFVDLATRLDDFDSRLKALPVVPNVEQIESIVSTHTLKTIEALPKAVDGKDADPELIAALVSKAVAELPPPNNGKDADPELIASLVSESVAKSVESLPKPADGKPGINAYEVAVSLGFEGTVHDWMKSLDGKAGEPGTSVTAEQVVPALKVELQKAIESLPIPKDGKDSKVTAEDFRQLFEAEISKALLDVERRAQDVLQKAIDRIPRPKDGKDGDDGLGFDDQSVSYDGERTFTLKFSRGDTVKEFPFKLAVLLDRGVYKSGQAYERGDCVSFDGSIWIAQKDTQSKPGTDDSWRLAVKRGRDGKDGVGKKGDPGDPGNPGRDLTQMGSDGSKW